MGAQMEGMGHTAALIVHRLALILINIHEESGKIRPAPLLSTLEKLAARLEENIYGSVVLTGFTVSGCESSGLLVCFVGLARCNERQDGFECSRRRRRPCGWHCYDYEKFDTEATVSDLRRWRLG